MKNIRRVILCADDYALTPAISRGIRQLIATKKLTATSCMVCSPFFEEEGEKIKKLDVDIGLHLSLTTLSPMIKDLEQNVGFPLTLAQFYTNYLLGNITLDFIEREFRQQIDFFEKIIGKSPDHIDSHHHIHQLPEISRLVSKIIEETLPDTPVRVTDDNFIRVVKRGSAPLKTFLINLLSRFAHKNSKISNQRIKSFSGIYSFSKHSNVERSFLKFFRYCADGELIMCHPGHMCDLLEKIDSLSTIRSVEFDYFSSEGFLSNLKDENIRLVRAKEL